MLETMFRRRQRIVAENVREEYDVEFRDVASSTLASLTSPLNV